MNIFSHFILNELLCPQIFSHFYARTGKISTITKLFICLQKIYSSDYTATSAILR